MTAPAAERLDRFYRGVRGVARFWMWFFFKRVDVRHPERIPRTGPVLLCVNHPNNMIDSLLVGTAVRRKVHFMATGRLFKNALLGRFLRAAGAIPVYRKQDDPHNMGKNVEAFAAVYASFDGDGVVAIYPEGTTHAEARVQRIKTGAARIALDYEIRRPGGLTIVPVGLSFEARKSFQGRVLVAFGPAVPVAPYAAELARDPAKAVEELTRAIQWAMEAQVVHVDRIEATALVRAVDELYHDTLVRALREDKGLAARQIDPFRIERTIVDAVEHFRTRDPERVEHIWQRIQAYRSLLAQYRLRDDAVRARAEGAPRRPLRWSWRAGLGFVPFAYGAVVNGLPYIVPRWLAHRFATHETDYATIRLLAGIVAIPVFWGAETWLVYRLAGVRWAAVFALSLPLSGVLAYRYLRGVAHLRRAARFTRLSLRQAGAARFLVAERQAILAELERAKTDYFTATRGSSF
ncbi:MAG: 1-acyl-sn-glycerol-3-phosphate acyltransferase [Candidatus Rokubacteria bacterium]|nr:1-acyl-sn-glycerol-3-phosphate acyltransferase [Candidatus Rokubacteria bacterium]